MPGLNLRFLTGLSTETGALDLPLPKRLFPTGTVSTFPLPLEGSSLEILESVMMDLGL